MSRSGNPAELPEEDAEQAPSSPVTPGEYVDDTNCEHQPLVLRRRAPRSGSGTLHSYLGECEQEASNSKAGQATAKGEWLAIPSQKAARDDSDQHNYVVKRHHETGL